MYANSDTICASATIPGTGAIGIIRTSGPEAIAIASRVVGLRHGSLESAQGYSIRFGCISDSDGSVVDEVLVSVFRAPHSYTGEDSVEISCHASAYIMGKILELLCKEGCRMAEPGEFTQRAFLAGKMDLAQAEAVADVIAADSAASHRLAMNQLRGHFSGEMKALRDRLLELSALLELELDFSEEEVEFANRSELSALATETMGRCRRLADSFRTGNAIMKGIPVAIVGAPNCGKSTLLNALCGDDRAIVSPIAGTTRDTIDATCTLDGMLMRFVDTAGIRKATDSIEQMGIERSLKEIGKAEIVIGLADCCEPDWQAQLEQIRSRVDESWQNFVGVANKVDACVTQPGGGGGAACDSSSAPAGVNCAGAIAISAMNGSGLDTLRQAISEAARSRFAQEGTVVINARHAQALSAAADDLGNVLNGLSAGIPGDLIAEDLRAALAHLGTILGESISADEVLGEIFGRFCIGK